MSTNTETEGVTIQYQTPTTTEQRFSLCFTIPYDSALYGLLPEFSPQRDEFRDAVDGARSSLTSSYPARNLTHEQSRVLAPSVKEHIENALKGAGDSFAGICLPMPEYCDLTQKTKDARGSKGRSDAMTYQPT